MDKPILLIDGECGFCRKWAAQLSDWLNDGGARDVEITPAQSVDLDAFGTTPERTQREVVLALPDNSLHGGAQAFAQWLIWRGGPSALLGRAATAPGVAQLLGLAYSAIAANRHRLPGPPAASLDQSPSAADPDQSREA